MGEGEGEGEESDSPSRLVKIQELKSWRISYSVNRHRCIPQEQKEESD
jgi:hypothetical protein